MSIGKFYCVVLICQLLSSSSSVILFGARESIRVQLVLVQSQEKYKFLQTRKMASCEGRNKH